MLVIVNRKGQAIQFVWPFLCVFFLLTSSSGEAQTSRHKKKRTSILNDSLQFYRKIETISKKRKVTYEIFRNIFTLPPPSKAFVASVKKQNDDIYGQAENKIIRNIYIVTLDPFGTDILDTSRRAISYVEKAGNNLHVKTKRFAIKNHLLFKEGDRADKLKLYESERIIRRSEYVSDATVRVDTNYKSKDSVDIMIREQDRWSINPSGGRTGGRYFVGLVDKNIVGTGQQFETTLFKPMPFDTSQISYRLRCFVPYIKNTFITVGLITNQQRGNQYTGISVGRTFYSPLTRWAAGIDVFNYDQSLNLVSSDSTVLQNFAVKYWTEDYWAGVAFPVTRSLSDFDKQTKLVLTGRVYNKHYQSAVPTDFDPNYSHQNVTNYLMSFGVTHRGYYKDKYIYKYGVTEDVPIGAMVSATVGYQKRVFDERYYLGIKTSYGVRFKKGYFSTYAEYGTYTTNKGKYQQGVANIGVNGFTSLVKLSNRFFYRQFFSLDITAGINRTKYDRLTINDVNGLRGFNPDSLVGSNKMVVSTSAIFYLPWQVLGFRFAPIFYGGFGMIGDEKISFFRDNLFPVFGLGLLIRNEYLIFNSILFSVGFYPYIPSVGSEVVKLNPFGSNDFKFRNFEIGKPGEVTYY